MQSFNRHNLKYAVLPKKGKAITTDIINLIQNQFHSQSGIVYCLSRWEKYRMLILTEDSLGLRLSSLPASMCVCECVCVCQSQAFPCDNSWPVQARLTKFEPKVKNTFVKSPYCLGGQSTMSFKVKFTSKVKFYPIQNLKFLRALTHHPFKPGSSNLDQRCKITNWVRIFIVFRVDR